MKRIASLLAITASIAVSDAAHAQRRHTSAHPRPASRETASQTKDGKSAESADAEQTPPAATPASGASAPPAGPVTGGSDAAAADAAAPARAAHEGVKAKTAEPSTDSSADLAAMEQELAQLMDDLVQARERVAVIGKSLFKTRVRVKIDNRAAPDQVAGKVVLRLDGAPIFEGDGSALHDADRALFDGYAAPGPHVLELEIEQRARSDESYRYGLREHYRFDVLRERRTDLRLVLKDASDIADDFHGDHKGEYDVRTRLEVRAVALNED